MAVGVFFHRNKPNAVNLFNRLKETVGDRIEFKRNLITLKDITELELLNNLEMLSSSRI